MIINKKSLANIVLIIGILALLSALPTGSFLFRLVDVAMFGVCLRKASELRTQDATKAPKPYEKLVWPLILGVWTFIAYATYAPHFS